MDSCISWFGVQAAGLLGDFMYSRSVWLRYVVWYGMVWSGMLVAFIFT